MLRDLVSGSLLGDAVHEAELLALRCRGLRNTLQVQVGSPSSPHGCRRRREHPCRGRLAVGARDVDPPRPVGGPDRVPLQVGHSCVGTMQQISQFPGKWGPGTTD